MATIIFRPELAPQEPPYVILEDQAYSWIQAPVPARTITMTVTLNTAVFPFAFDKFIAQPLAAEGAINGLKVTSLKTVPLLGLIQLGYPSALANLPLCPLVPISVPLPTDETGQLLAERLQAYANAVLAPMALAALAAYGTPSGATPTSLVFSGATWAVVPPPPPPCL